MAVDFSRIFAANGLLEAPSDNQYLQGFAFLGSNPPTYRLFNYMFQNIDLKLQHLFSRQNNQFWVPLYEYKVGDIIYPSIANSYKRLECVVAGKSGSTEPTWTAVGTLVADGTVTWIVDDIRDGTPVGRSVLEHRSTPRPGYVKKNGALLLRANYPRLWRYAQESGLIVTESQWVNGMRGCFSNGDGSTTFRIPDGRGEFERGWDDGRGIDAGRTIGSSQGDAIRNITGTIKFTEMIGGTPATGVFQETRTATPRTFRSSGDGYNTVVDFDASRTVPTSSENRPRNIALLACIKY